MGTGHCFLFSIYCFIRFGLNFAICSVQILADNLVERLPMNLGKLQSLKVMTLDGNRISGLPDECKFTILNQSMLLYCFYPVE